MEIMPDNSGASICLVLDQAGLQEFAAQLSQTLCPGITLALRGDLGTGKTTFARYLLQALAGKEINVPSPTFTLVQVYDFATGQVWHCDLYRLDEAHEAVELGLEDAFHEAVCLVEWPEIIEGMLPQNHMDITFKILSETVREVSIMLRQAANPPLHLSHSFSQVELLLQSFSKSIPVNE